MTVTTQQTSKVFKVLQLVGVLLIIASFVAYMLRMDFWWAYGFIFGGLLYAVGRISAWWWHG
jgi:hypothetical protein